MSGAVSQGACYSFTQEQIIALGWRVRRLSETLCIPVLRNGFGVGLGAGLETQACPVFLPFCFICITTVPRNLSHGLQPLLAFDQKPLQILWTIVLKSTPSPSQQVQLPMVRNLA